MMTAWFEGYRKDDPEVRFSIASRLCIFGCFSAVFRLFSGCFPAVFRLFWGAESGADLGVFIWVYLFGVGTDWSLPVYVCDRVFRDDDAVPAPGNERSRGTELNSLHLILGLNFLYIFTGVGTDRSQCSQRMFLCCFYAVFMLFYAVLCRFMPFLC